MVIEAKRKGIPLIINDRPEVALSLGASGVHLGKSDIAVGIARKMLGPGAIIGRTVRNVRELKQLDKKCVDYASIGPLFNTPLKPGLKTVPILKLRQLCKKTDMPLVGIGGINSSNVEKIVACGINTVAFVRYALKGKDTTAKIKKLKEKINAAERK